MTCPGPAPQGFPDRHSSFRAPRPVWGFPSCGTGSSSGEGLSPSRLSSSRGARQSGSRPCLSRKGRKSVVVVELLLKVILFPYPLTYSGQGAIALRKIGRACSPSEGTKSNHFSGIPCPLTTPPFPICPPLLPSDQPVEPPKTRPWLKGVAMPECYLTFLI